ncbi:Zn-ribbon domain-containing OB-fold protein [Nocardia carnea]|uniref:Zn-ribbon domain-containing OB-fold protein n=1 Tax=Nocardia carnea TaxID=37328 RepID=UPI002456C60F|nr:OB-fold domain-containing protein [Nocardia carnea]
MHPFRSEIPGSSGPTTAEHGPGILMIRRCARCDRLFAPLTVDCASCASSDLEPVPSCGAGSILSWRVVERGVTDTAAPLTIAIVELDEGPWVYASIEGRIPAAPCGPVRVGFQPCPREDRFPVFAVIGETGGGGGAAPPRGRGARPPARAPRT